MPSAWSPHPVLRPSPGTNRSFLFAHGACGAERFPAPQLPPLCVLIVDDVSDAAASLALLVGLWGHRAVVAADGPSALRVARAESPDVVLLDLGLPGMDGYEAARRLRQEAGLRQALLVALTGYADGDHRRLADEAGLDLYLVKPVELDALERVLASVRGGAARSGGSGGPPRFHPRPSPAVSGKEC